MIRELLHRPKWWGRPPPPHRARLRARMASAAIAGKTLEFGFEATPEGVAMGVAMHYDDGYLYLFTIPMADANADAMVTALGAAIADAEELRA